jgi:endoglycosylceramidase
MTITNGAPNNHAPFAIGYLDNLAEDAAWDYFWADTKARDGVGLEDHYAAGLARIARAFSGVPGLLGFEILNEPWPGVLWPTCASPLGCPPAGFDQTLLTDFYRRVLPALRAADPTHLIVYEPNLLFDYGAATQLARLPDPNLVLAFHNYCLANAPGLTSLPAPGQVCGGEEDLVFENAEARSTATGDGLLMDEWGNTTDLAEVNRIAAEADQHMVGWSEWAYEDCCHSPAAIVKDASVSPTVPGNLNLPVLRALVRPYPKLIAGTPTQWGFDPVSDTFSLTYSTAPVAGGSFPAGVDTEIEVPALQYPTGYTVGVTGATVTSAPDANLLRLVAVPGATSVHVAIEPADHHPSAPGPFTWPSATIAPADCPDAARLTVRLKTRSRRIAVYVDGVRVDMIRVHRRSHRIRRIELPAGLADGTVIRLVAGRRAVTTHLFSCRLRG